MDHPAIRARIVAILDRRQAALASDAASVSPFAAGDKAAGEVREHLVALTLAVLRTSLRDADLDRRGPEVTELAVSCAGQQLAPRQLAALIHLVERTLLDELALDDEIGATSEPWPVVVRLVHTSAYDALAVTADHAFEVGSRVVEDARTTLHSRAVLELAIEKELRRAERFGHPLAFLLLDVDRLSDLNVAHGYGFGDRVLERIGIVMRTYFREHDWVARHGEDSFAVLLPETPTAHAEPLAHQVRKMVEERLSLQDHRTGEPVPITVSVAVLVADSHAVSGSVRGAHVLAQAEQALMRAKAGGRNRVERIEIPPAPEGGHPEQRRRTP